MGSCRWVPVPAPLGTLWHRRVPVLLEQHLGDHRELRSGSAVFPAQLAFMGLPFPAITLQVSPCISQLLHNFLEETSGPGQSHFAFKMHSARGAAGSLEQKEHLCELLFLASFCLFLLGYQQGPGLYLLILQQHRANPPPLCWCSLPTALESRYWEGNEGLHSMSISQLDRRTQGRAQGCTKIPGAGLGGHSPQFLSCFRGKAVMVPSPSLTSPMSLTPGQRSLT